MATTDAAGAPAGPAAGVERSVESRYLHQIISTVSSTLDLDRVLRAIVDLVTEAIDCHACFLYFVDPEDESLVLRAVSDPYGALVGRLRFEPGEGLAGWVARHGEPVFLRENALADPRVKVVPEADEEKYQSLVAVPLTTPAGRVIGVIALHAEAPREFTRADSDFLATSAHLVAGAVENARLYEDTARRLGLVEGLSELARAVSAAATLDDLLPGVARRTNRLLRAPCRLLLVRPDSGALVAAASSPADDRPARTLTAPDVGVDVALAGRDPDAAARLAAALWGDGGWSALVEPLVAADELLGFLALRLDPDRRLHADERDIAASIASQTAVAIKKVQLIDRLTERHAIKELLEDLAHGGAAGSLRERAAALGADLDRPHLVLSAVPREPGAAWEEVADDLERDVGRAFAGAVVDRHGTGVRGLVPLRGDARAVVARLRELHERLGERHPFAIGVSGACAGIEALRTGFAEADDAVLAASVVATGPAVVAFDDLGAYKYLLRMSQEGRVRDRRGEALAVLGEYDRRHQAQLLHTLECYLERRGNIAAAAQALYVHPNTLRQRLRRIHELTGLDVAHEDWLMIEIELKLLRLEEAVGRPA